MRTFSDGKGRSFVLVEDVMAERDQHRAEADALTQAIKLLQQDLRWIGYDSQKLHETEVGELARRRLLETEKLMKKTKLLVKESVQFSRLQRVLQTCRELTQYKHYDSVGVVSAVVGAIRDYDKELASG